MTRLLLLTLAGLCLSHAGTPANVLFIIADDASRHFGETYYCSWVKTPNIDRLAKEGLAFDNAYTPTSKCAPSRASILTGRNPWQNGQAANHQNFFPPDLPVFSESLAKQGIMTGSHGKVWGPGRAMFANGHSRNFALPSQAGQQQPAQAFAEFLRNRKDHAFFFWFGSKDPHRGYQAELTRKAGHKASDIDRLPAYLPDNEIVRRDLLDYGAEIERFDTHVGEMLKVLDDRGLADSTLVIVTSDHGMPFPRVKGHTFDDAHRIPLVMRWPAGIKNPGRRVKELTSFIDLAPTISDVMKLKDPASDLKFTGQALTDLLEDQPSRKREFVLIGRERNDVYARRGSTSGLGYPVRGIRMGPHLLIHNLAPERWPCGDPDLGLLDTDQGPSKEFIESLGPDSRLWQSAFGKRPEFMLFDVTRDPDCVHNLAPIPQHHPILEQLNAKLQVELKAQNDPRMTGGGDQFDYYPTVIPAPVGWTPSK